MIWVLPVPGIPTKIGQWLMLMNYVIKNEAEMVSTVGMVYDEILLEVSMVETISLFEILLQSSSLEFSIST
jgi:hypothetical protein